MSAGGYRPNAGRKKGVPNKVTAEIRAMAQEHGPKAIQELVKIMQKARNETTRIAACKELLDRAYGKYPQAPTGDPDNSLRLPTNIENTLVSPTIDGLLQETRDDWVARRKRELATTGAARKT